MFDEEFQWSIVVRCLRPEFWVKVGSFIAPAMFSGNVAPVLAFVKKAYIKEDKPPSRMVIKQKFGLSLPKEDRDSSEAADVDELREVSSRWHLDDVISTIQDAADRGTLDEAWALMSGNKGTPTGGSVRCINALLDDPRKSPAIRDTTATGITPLDRLLGGGLGRKELGILAAPANRGKSSILAFIGGSAVKQGKTVTHLSLEMDDEQMSAKYRRRLLGLSHMDQSRMTIRQQHNKLKAIAKKSGSKGIFVRQLISKKHTVADLRQFVQADKSDLLIVDYSDHLRPITRRQDKRLELAEIEEDLRALAVEENIAVWDAAQVARSAYDKAKAGMEDVAECIQKAHVADIMITFNQNATEGTCDEVGESSGRIFVAKNRYGAARDVIDVTVNFGLCHVYSNEAEDFA